MRLETTQRTLWQLITTPDGGCGAEGFVRGDQHLDAAGRVDVYASMYRARLLECLREDFPALHAVVGHVDFHALVADYLVVHPSKHPSLRRFGEGLGDFLAEHPLAERHFWLADLARFEWNLLEAFDAPDAAPLGAASLAEIAAPEWPEMRLVLTPSLRVLELSASVDEAWEAASASREIPTLERATTRLRIWREGLGVFHRRIEEVELAAIRAVTRGERFAGVCAAAARIVGEEAAAAVLQVLRRWIGDGMIISLDGGRNSATRSGI